MKTILVVDDRESNRILLGKMLSSMDVGKDFCVQHADSGQAAIEICSKSIPDLILMDYNMPNKTGCEAAKEIKYLVGDDYVPIIFVTAMRSDSILQEALSSGGDDYVSKPFDIGVLKSKINAHLRIRDLNQKLNERYIHLSREQELIEHFFENALDNSYLDDRYIKYHMSSMSAFNGDVLLTKKGPQGGLYILVGDFTGHGLSAAMGTLPVAMIFFKMASKGLPLNNIARELNAQLHALMPTNMFFASTMMYLSENGERLSIWMGGMPECYWMGNDGQIKGLFQSQHMPLGILDNADFDDTSEEYEVIKGDKIYIFTDGVTEAMNFKDEIMFGQKLDNILSRHSHSRLENVISEFRKFTGDSDQKDDITMVELTCKESIVDQSEFMSNEYMELTKKVNVI